MSTLRHVGRPLIALGKDTKSYRIGCKRLQPIIFEVIEFIALRFCVVTCRLRAARHTWEWILLLACWRRLR